MNVVETWGYFGVFVAAATPWLEILLVIPAGVALGLAPVPVGVVAFVGNALPVVGIVLAYEAVARRRRAARDLGAAANPDEQPTRRSARRRRAAQLMERYGLPALALAGPLVTGIHLATAMALGLGARRGPVLAWMTASLALWTLGIVVVAEIGVGLLRG